MALTFYYGSGSPYAWRVWYALEHKRMPYTFKLLSFDAGDLQTPAFMALNPRGRVPVIVDGDFILYESSAIMEYLEDTAPEAPRLFAADPRARARQRRMIREADAYVGPAMEHMAEAILYPPGGKSSDAEIKKSVDEGRKELGLWDRAMSGEYLAGDLSAADYTLYPFVALMQRFAARQPSPLTENLIGPKLSAWAKRMAALPITQKTRPPHWK